MAIMRMTDARKLSEKERQAKIGELRLELTKAMNKASQTKGKTKELKRAISRLLTLSHSAKEGSRKH